MYEIDGVCYAGNPTDEIHAVAVKPLIGGMILVLFSTGEKKLFDTTLLEGSAFKPLDDPKIFNTAEVFHGFIRWANGAIDIAPEYLYDHGIAYDESDCFTAS